MKITKGRKKKRGYGGVAIFVLLVLIMGTIIAYTLYSPYFNIKTIEVRGQDKVTKQEVLNLCGVYPGENIFRANLKKTSERIKSGAPYVETVNIRRVFPDKVVLGITERKACGALEYMGSYIYVDKNGVALELNTRRTPKSLIEIRGIPVKKFTIGKELKDCDISKLKSLLKILSMLDTELNNKNINYIDINDTDYPNEVIILIDRRVIVIMGTIEELTSKGVSAYRISFLNSILDSLAKDEAGTVNLTEGEPRFTPKEEQLDSGVL